MNELRRFLGTYFHQDWIDDHASGADVVSAYRRQSTASERARVRREIEQLLARKLGDDELRRALFDEFHCYLCPPGDAAEWLRTIAKDLC